MPLPFNTSKYDDYENPAPLIKVGGLSAQDATDPYAIYEKQALEANDAKWKAKTEALRAARMDTPDKMERIAQALLAFGAPTRGNNFAALSNATKALSMSGKEVEDAQRERTNQLAQIAAQQQDAAAAIREKYGFAGAQARQAVNLKRMDTPKTGFSPTTGVQEYMEGENIGLPVRRSTLPTGTPSARAPEVVKSGDYSFIIDQKGNPQVLPKATREPPTAAEVAKAAEDLAKAKQVGEAAGVAQSALSGAKTNVNSTMALIEKLESHKGLDAVIGLPNPMKGGWGVAQVPGSEAADFKTDLDNLTGKMFIAAFESLKGGGAISEKEGEAATRAIANLSKSQSGKQFRQNLAILKQTLANGYATLEQKAKGSAGSAPAAPETKTVNGVTYEKRGNDWYAK